MNTAGIDNAIGFTSYTYDKVLDLYFAQARFYDANIRRFIAIDPIKDGVNWYAYCGNNPIVFVDPTGLKIEISCEASEAQKEQYKKAIEYLKRSGTFRDLWQKLEDATEIIKITFNSKHDDSYDGAWTIAWDPTSGLKMKDQTSSQSAALGLAHEMGHATQHLDGTYFSFATYNDREIDVLDKYETPIAKQLDEPMRKTPDDVAIMNPVIRMKNSIHYRTTHKRSWTYYIALWNWGKPGVYTKDHNAE